jgi:hypothetical protein
MIEAGEQIALACRQSWLLPKTNGAATAASANA